MRLIGKPLQAGASEHELMAMFGWEDADMARIYTRKAAQKRLAASGAAKLAYSQIAVQPAVLPVKYPQKNNDLGDIWRTRQDLNL